MLPSLKQQQKQQQQQLPFSNSKDDEYPWYFRGRAMLRPALVRVPNTSNLSQQEQNLMVLSVFGWTLGGTVILEYDESPVGKYREYVDLGGLAIINHRTSSMSKQRWMIGQYGSRLSVSTQSAEKLCQQVWDLTAEPADIKLIDDTLDGLNAVALLTNEGAGRRVLAAQGWNILRKGEDSNTQSLRSLPLLWTPKIKAIWTAFLSLRTSFQNSDSAADARCSSLPLHRLRISGNVKVLINQFQSAGVQENIPLGFDIALQNMLIEISPQVKD
jgi:hypothetical protein